MFGRRYRCDNPTTSTPTLPPPASLSVPRMRHRPIRDRLPARDSFTVRRTSFLHHPTGIWTCHARSTALIQSADHRAGVVGGKALAGGCGVGSVFCSTMSRSAAAVRCWLDENSAAAGVAPEPLDTHGVLCRYAVHCNVLCGHERLVSFLRRSAMATIDNNPAPNSQGGRIAAAHLCQFVAFVQPHVSPPPPVRPKRSGCVKQTQCTNRATSAIVPVLAPAKVPPTAGERPTCAVLLPL
jgi:hypothetical protein